MMIISPSSHEHEHMMYDDHEPGTHYEYSNLGAGVLGYILTKLYNRSYNELLHQKIFLSYNMLNSTSNITFVQKNIIRGRDSLGSIVQNWTFDVLNPAGGIFSSVKDLSFFVNANLQTDEILELQQERET